MMANVRRRLTAAATGVRGVAALVNSNLGGQGRDRAGTGEGQGRDRAATTWYARGAESGLCPPPYPHIHRTRGRAT